MRWWGLQIFCPDCKVETGLESVLFAADGEFLITAQCPLCHQVVKHNVYASHLAWQAAQCDRVAEREARKPKQIAAPKEEPKDETATEDENFLHGIGIRTDEESEE